MKKQRIYQLAANVSLVTLLCGCGGGGGNRGNNTPTPTPTPVVTPAPNPTPTPEPVVSPTPFPSPSPVVVPPTRTAIRVRVDFPAIGRLVPVAAQCIEAVVKQGDAVVGLTVLVRPQNGGIAEFVFDNLPVETFTVQTTGFEGTAPGGTPLSTGIQNIVARAGSVEVLDISMTSTVESLTLTPTADTVEVGDTISIGGIGKNGAGQVVLSAPSTWNWTSTNPGVATVDANGTTVTVRGASSGTTDIRATETESGKTATVSVEVLKPAPTLLVRQDRSLLWFNGRKPVAASRTTPVTFESGYDRIGLLPDGNLVVNYSGSIAVVDRVSGAVGATSSILNGTIDALLPLPSGKVLVHSNFGFSIFNPTNGTIETRNQLDIFDEVRDMTLGADGNIYLVADYRLNQGNTDDVVARVRINSDGTFSEDAILRRQTGARFTAIRFLSDGKLAIADDAANTIRVFELRATTVEPLEVSVNTPTNVRVTIGRDIFRANDEILYALYSNVIRRYRYEGGNLTALDSAESPYLRPPGGSDDLLIVP